jgi:hypothetical protein
MKTSETEFRGLSTDVILAILINRFIDREKQRETEDMVPIMTGLLKFYFYNQH